MTLVKNKDKSLPVDFSVIGASKCGTTSLHNYLQQHQKIFLPDMKETHYFSFDELAKNTSGPGDKYVLEALIKSRIDYCNKFSTKKNDQMAGDISPSYFYFSDSVADKIKATTMPGFKIIIMLRNPIDKVFSQYSHLVRDGRETLEFEDALSNEETRYKNGWSDMWLYSRSGFYYDNTKKYIDVFGKENVMVLTLEEFKVTPQLWMEKICLFLNVEPINFQVDKIFNKSGQPKSRFIAKYILGGRMSTVLKKIVPLRIGKAASSIIRTLNTGDKQKISKSARVKLNKLYEEDVKKTNDLIGRNIINL